MQVHLTPPYQADASSTVKTGMNLQKDSFGN